MNSALTIHSPLTKKEQQVENIKKTSHDEYDENGDLQTNQYVEYTVIGKNRKWTEFMSLSEFRKLNPEVKIN